MWTYDGRKVDRDCPLPEYPTPQFARDSYLCLNGEWDFYIDESPNNHSFYPQKILVPFSVETPLSGIEHRVTAEQTLHYRRTFTLPEGFRKQRVLLHFEAVDQRCDVYLNGVRVVHHEGGYLPFTIDCLELRDGENELCVDVQDDVTSPAFPRGKQSPKSTGIWYEGTSGIWGSVWLESVPNQVIQSLRLTPDYDGRKIKVEAAFEGKAESSDVEVSLNGHLVAKGELDANLSCLLDVSSNFHPWSPEHPILYDLRIRINDDEVKSYFAMRKFSSLMHEGHRVFALNDKPYFLSGLLDQGYYPDGGLTPPTDEAMVNDIEFAKRMGFNMLRKHIKIEPMRWYYHCDRLGMIVIQDFINGGDPYKLRYIALAPFFSFHFKDTEKYARFGSQSEAWRKRFEEDMAPIVKRLYNSPCIAAWTLFNEGWGQFDSVRLTAKLRELDPTRLIDSTSGWHDQGAGDFCSKHIYFKKVRLDPSPDRILFLSEFGGYVHAEEGHSVKGKGVFYARKKDLTQSLVRLYEDEIVPCLADGLSATVLTQLTDVEQELNGLITYDRKVVKVDEKAMKAINEKLHFEVKDDD